MLSVRSTVAHLIADWRPLCRRLLVFVGCVMLALTAMGLYNARQRARTLGLLLRALVAHTCSRWCSSRSWFVLRAAAASAAGRSCWPGRRCRCCSSCVVAHRRRRVGRRGRVQASRARVRRGPARAEPDAAAPPRRSARLRRRRLHAGARRGGAASSRARSCRDPWASCARIAKELGVDEIVVAMDDRRREFPVRELLDCRLNGVEVIDIVNFLERETGRVHLDVLNPSWIIFAEGFRRDALRQATKRAVRHRRVAWRWCWSPGRSCCSRCSRS